MCVPSGDTVNVLFIGKRFYTNRDALEDRFGRIYQLPMHWARKGANVRLWLVDYHGSEAAEATDGSGMRVVSTPIRSMAFFRQWFRAFRKGAGDRPDVVVASGDCYVGLLGYRLAKRHGARFVFDVYDKYDEFGAYVRLPGLDLFRFLLRKADACLFASHGLMRRLAGQVKAALFVPNGVDTERFRALDQATSRDALGLPRDARLVGYFGSMEPDRGIGDLLDAVHLLRQNGMAVELLMAGKRHPGLDLDRPGVRYLGTVPYGRIAQVMACCDVLALPYRRSPFMDVATSCKIAEYMASARPIAATRTPLLLENFPTQAQALDDLLAEPGNAASLAESIRAQLGQRRLVDPPEGWSWEAIAADVERRLAELSTVRT